MHGEIGCNATDTDELYRFAFACVCVCVWGGGGVGVCVCVCFEVHLMDLSREVEDDNLLTVYFYEKKGNVLLDGSSCRIDASVRYSKSIRVFASDFELRNFE